MSIPVGLTADGLPVGLELDAPEGTDRNLLGLGLAIERLFGKLHSPQAEVIGHPISDYPNT